MTDTTIDTTDATPVINTTRLDVTSANLVQQVNEVGVVAVLNSLLRDKTELTDQKNQAYWERNQLLMLLAKVAHVQGWGTWMGKHDESDLSWDRDWLNILYIETPGGQASWHLHDSEVSLFSFLPKEDTEWDGHTTDEKYKRLREIELADLIF